MTAPQEPDVTAVPQPDVSDSIYGYARQIANNATKAAQEEIDKLKFSNRELEDIIVRQNEMIERFAPLIDTIQELEKNAKDGKGRFIYHESDQMFLQQCDEIAKQLGNAYNVGKYQTDNRNTRIRKLIDDALRFVIKDALDLFLAHASQNYYGR